MGAIRLIRQSHHVLGIKELVIVLLLLKNVDFVFLLLARHSSNTFGSAPAACVGSGDLYRASSRDRCLYPMTVWTAEPLPNFRFYPLNIQNLSPLDILILKASEENERKPQRPLNIVGIMRIAKVIKHIPWDLLYDFRQLRIQISAHDLFDMNNIANLINHESLSISQSFKIYLCNLCYLFRSDILIKSPASITLT